MNKRIVVISIIALLLIGLSSVIYLWNKPHANAWNAKLVYSNSADAVINTFFTAPDTKAEEWTEAAIGVTGTPIALPESAVLEFKTENGVISCALSENAVIPEPNKELELRGFFTGFDEGIPGFDDMMPSIYLIRCEWKPLE
jgi:hypothetical protein